MSHLQDQPDLWESATDEQLIEAVFKPPPGFVNPTWMAFLQRERPKALATYLRMFHAQGGYQSPIARRFLRGRGRR